MRKCLGVEAARDGHAHQGRARRLRPLGLGRGELVVEQQETALGTHQGDGVVDDQAQEPHQVRLAHQLARDAREHAQVVALLLRLARHGLHADLAERDRGRGPIGFVDALRVAGTRGLAFGLELQRGLAHAQLVAGREQRGA